MHGVEKGDQIARIYHNAMGICQKAKATWFIQRYFCEEATLLTVIEHEMLV